MPKWRKKKADFDRREIALTKADWEAESPGELRSMLLELHLIREFETKLIDLGNAGLVHGPVHTSVGQEAVAVGAMAALRRSDGIAGTHRAHHQYLAKACTHLLPDGFDALRAPLPEALRDEIRSLMAEIMGLAPGCCGGRGGSMHLCNPEIGVLGTNAIVAGGVPIATGAAWAETYRGTDRVVACFFGDGALNQGAFHEALNLGALWKARAVYVLENNRYAVATCLEEAFPVCDLSVRASAYGMPARIVDGMDPLAVKLALADACGIVRDGGGPVFVEARTFRYFHHAGGTPGSAFDYRTKEEEAKWRKLDPIETFAAKLRRMKLLSAGEGERLHSVAKAVVDEAAESCLATDESGATIVAPALWPEPASITVNLRSDGNELTGVRYVEAEDVDCSREAKYVEAIAGITEWWLEHDPGVFVLGE
ncbi:MAG: thiamine pyrophosphate-dependent dehydrogenase E1 component subunit alpha, partial [Planctomycetota bacterium]